MPDSATDTPRDHTRPPAAAALAMVAAAALVAAASAALHYPAYAHALGLDTLGASLPQRLLVAWSIASLVLVLTAPALLLAVALAAARRPRLGWAVLLTLGSLVAAFVWCDRVAYTGYGVHLLGLLDYRATPGSASMAGGFTRWIPTALGITLASAALYAVAAFFARRVVRARWPVDRRLGTRRLTLVTLAVLALLVAGPWSLRHYLADDLLFQRVLGVFPVDWRTRYANLAPRPIDDPVLAALDARGRAVVADAFTRLTRPVPLDRSATLELDSPPDVVFLICESLNHRLDHHGLLPKLRARLAGRGLHLDRHYSGSHHSETSLFSLLYGREPLRFHPSLDADQPPQLNVTLAAAGYTTAFFTGHPKTWFRREAFVNDRVWDRYAHHDAGAWPEWDRAALDGLADLLNTKRDQPALAVALLITAHYPYQSPDAYAALGPDDLPDSARAHYATLTTDTTRTDYMDYQRAVRYLDDQLVAFLDRIDLARTVVVITGDHGESLMDDGGWGHDGPLSDARTRTPLWILGPGVPDRTIATATMHADVLPTLLHALAGRPVPLAGIDGRDLLADAPPRDEILLAYPDRDGYTTLLAIRGDRRLSMLTHLRQAGFRVQGFEDPAGKLIPTPALTPADLDAWTTMLHRHLTGAVSLDPP